jgi:hypothetical protein
MHKAVVRAVMIALGLVSAAAVEAASVEVNRDLMVDLPVIFVAGELHPGDSEIFARVASGFSRAVVVFNSPGGAALEGIALGRNIRGHGFATAVFPGHACLSACALAFLGGSVRFLDRGATVGFHAVFTEANGTRQEVGAGNALVGAYLSSLGLSDQAIFYMTVAPPDDLAELTPAIAKTLGIDVEFVGEPGTRSPLVAALPQPPAEPPPLPAGLEEAAERFIVEHFAAAAAMSGEAWLAHAADAYAPTVDFYGERLPRASVLERNGAYIRKWPTRRNTLRGRPEVACTGAFCIATGLADFVAQHAGRNARASGTVRYRIELAMGGDGPRIVAESNEKIAQRIAPLVPGGTSLAAKLQRALARIGCYTGAVDGIWGTGSQKAMTRFNAVSRRAFDAEVPTEAGLAGAGGLFAPRCTQ